MNQYFLKNLWLLLSVCGLGYGPLMAQNPDWPIVPKVVHFTSSGPNSPTTMPGTYPAQYFASNCAQDASGNISQSNVTITGTYAVPLTESKTWIVSSGACSIAANSTVELYADPVNGYIQLNPGFSAIAALNVVFVAQAYNGCAPGAPLRPSSEERENAVLRSIESHQGQSASIFPNPTTGDFTLEFVEALGSEALVTVMDLTGRTILQTTLQQGVSSQALSLGHVPSGIYVVRASSNGKPIWTGRVVKE